jgi:hypothetical protein
MYLLGFATCLYIMMCNNSCLMKLLLYNAYFPEIIV